MEQTFSKKWARRKLIGDQVFIETIQTGGIQIIKNRMLNLFIGRPSDNCLWVKPYYNELQGNTV